MSQTENIECVSIHCTSWHELSLGVQVPSYGIQGQQISTDGSMMKVLTANAVSSYCLPNWILCSPTSTAWQPTLSFAGTYLHYILPCFFASLPRRAVSPANNCYDDCLL